MLELKINHKGQDKYFYGEDLEAVALESFELYKNDEKANEYINSENYEDYVKDFLNGELKYVGEDVEYLKDIEIVSDMDYIRTLDFLKTLDDEIKQHIKLDEFNQEFYVEYDKGAYQISEQLTELAEKYLYE